MRIGFNALFSTEFTLSSIKSLFSQLDLEFEQCEEGASDWSIVPLHLLSINRNPSTQVFCLLPMSTRQNALAIRKDVYHSNDRIGFEQEAEVSVPEGFIGKKLKEFRSDITYRTLENQQILTKIGNAELKNAILESCFVTSGIEENYKLIKLHEREFGHAPGQGFLALMGPRHHQLSSLFKKLNKNENTVVCNIERTVAKEWGQKILTHCEMDKAGNLHLWVFSEFGDANISQSTRHNIEERVLSKLRVNFKSF